METTIGGSALEALKDALKGDAYVPSDGGYDGARAAWNLNAHQSPALVVAAEGAADVLAAVRLARDEGLGVGVMATGHGVAAPCDGGVLINTSRMRGVHVDPETRTARVEAGAKWADLVPEAAAHGLAGLQGSTSHVGIVTSLEFALYPVTRVFGGNLFYPVERAEEVLELYSRWAEDLPEEVTSAVTFLNIPPMPHVPEPLRGRSVIAVRFCYTGEDLSEETRWTLVDLAGADSDTPLLLLEIRQLGGALSRPPGDLNPMGRSDAAYIMNGIGATFTPEMAQAVQAYLAHVAEAAKPHATGATYVNFMDLDGASPERVKAAYSAEDWGRLVELKDRRDPANLFRFNRNIPPSSAEGANGTRSTNPAT